jgi:anthranilate synthase component 1
MGRQDTVIKILAGERFTPYGLAKKLGAIAILESSSFQKGRERYSLLMVQEAFRLSQTDDGVIMDTGQKRYRIRSNARDILDVQLYFANQHTQPHQDFPFPAGGIGYLSYEFAKHCDTIRFQKREDPLGMPDACFIFGHVFVVFDHYTDLLYLIGINYKEHEVDLGAAVAETEARINDLDFNYLQDEERSYTAELVENGTDRKDYMDRVEALKKEIVAGNLLQGVPSRRLQIRTELPAIEAYRRLRRANPSPYQFFVDFGAYQLFGASPEMHVKVKEGEVTIRPIAGTRRRGSSREQDRSLERDLLSDPKERAEHLMLVDLARNDIGRVSRPGSVHVASLMGIEHYSHVMHIVSEARGTLEEGRTGADAVRATFPAGTVSGAPKIQAIETIDRLEPFPRRFYAGVVGYMEPGGDLDTCIAIRSAMKRDDILTLQAGGGVVHDSTPEREFEETTEKLGALLRAADLEV